MITRCSSSAGPTQALTQTEVPTSYSTPNHGATGNRAFLTDEKVDELIIAAQKESDDTKRMGLYKELQDRLHEISPWCPLYYKYDNVGVRADLKGFKLHKGAQHYLGNCHYEK